MRPYFSILIFFFIGIEICNAQFSNSIRTGRPGVSIGPFTVGRQLFQIQSGISAFGNNISGSSNILNTDHVLRLGLTETFEVSTLIEVQKHLQENVSGLNNFALGFRYNFAHKPKGLIPAIGLQTRFRVPVLSADYSIKKTVPIVTLVTHHSLPKNISFNMNFGYTLDGNSLDPTYSYIFNLSFPITSKWSGFIENYGRNTLGKIYNFYDGGFAYLLNNDLQLDLYGGIGNNYNTLDYFASAGISWRMKYRK